MDTERGSLITTVSALFVRADGPYPTLVADWWDAERDARLYAGPNPVVAHPPCARWGNLWWSARHQGKGLGDDGGCFASAIGNLRRVGGVLEHPANSRAWPRFGIARPVPGAWRRSLLRPDEWVTEVQQRNYGHRALKSTWLVLVGEPLDLDWSPPAPPEAYVTSDRPMAELHARGVELMGRRERELTPLPFARLLVTLARTACAEEAA